jgi:hypothetical protein
MTSLKQQKITRENHFVPRGLLRPWRWPDKKLRGYWWDQRRAQLRCKGHLGVDAFCFQIDLLTTRTRAGLSDELERTFEAIDTPGIAARDRMLSVGPASLSNEQRCDFARLLMSLEARRPHNVAKARTASQEVRRILDNDQEVVERLEAEGITQAPSDWWDDTTQQILHEGAFARFVTDLANRADIGERLINSYWRVFDLSEMDGTLVLSDRPLFRSKGFLTEGANWYWLLPLSPKSAFLATNSLEVVRQIESQSTRRLRKHLNVSSAAQSERFVFSADGSHAGWVAKYLKR